LREQKKNTDTTKEQRIKQGAIDRKEINNDMNIRIYNDNDTQEINF